MRRLRLSEPAVLIGLAVFLLVDVLLVVAALQASRPDPPQNAGRTPQGVSSSAPDGGATDDGASEPSPTTKRPSGSSGVSLPPEPVSVGVVVLDAERAWRFSRGSCDGGGSTLEVTTDAGATWEKADPAFATTSRVRVRDNGTAFAVGSDDESCEPMIRQAQGSTPEWGDPAAVSDAWYRDLVDPSVVGTPLDEPAKPCDDADVLDLSVTDDGADALCADGRVLRSDDGQEWERQGSVDGAVALARTPEGESLVARPGAVGCRGLEVVDAATPKKPLGFAALDLTKVKPGTVGLGSHDSQVWLVASGEVFRSSGDLSEWSHA